MTLVVEARLYYDCVRAVQDCHDHQLQVVDQFTVGLPPQLDLSPYSLSLATSPLKVSKPTKLFLLLGI